MHNYIPMLGGVKGVALHGFGLIIIWSSWQGHWNFRIYLEAEYCVLSTDNVFNVAGIVFTAYL